MAHDRSGIGPWPGLKRWEHKARRWTPTGARTNNICCRMSGSQGTRSHFAPPMSWSTTRRLRRKSHILLSAEEYGRIQALILERASEVTSADASGTRELADDGV